MLSSSKLSYQACECGAHNAKVVVANVVHKCFFCADDSSLNMKACILPPWSQLGLALPFANVFNVLGCADWQSPAPHPAPSLCRNAHHTKDMTKNTNFSPQDYYSVLPSKAIFDTV
jgi:hypothetical protein